MSDATDQAPKTTTAQRRRWWPMVIAIVLAAVVVGAAGWAAATVLRPADDPLDATAFTYVTVEPGSVGSSINLNTVAVFLPRFGADIKKPTAGCPS